MGSSLGERLPKPDALGGRARPQARKVTAEVGASTMADFFVMDYAYWEFALAGPQRHRLKFGLSESLRADLANTDWLHQGTADALPSVAADDPHRPRPRTEGED